jgi:hypothetical protein
MMSLRAQRGNLTGQVTNFSGVTYLMRLTRYARNDIFVIY